MVPVTFCGRTFTAQEVELMRVMAHDYAGLGVTEIARTVCELLEWKRCGENLELNVFAESLGPEDQRLIYESAFWSVDSSAEQTAPIDQAT